MNMNKYLRFPSFAIPISLAISLTSCGPKADSALAAVQAVEGLTSLPGETEAISTLTIMPIPTETPASIFRPAPGTIWQWQLDTPIDIKDLSVNGYIDRCIELPLPDRAWRRTKDRSWSFSWNRHDR